MDLNIAVKSNIIIERVDFNKNDTREIERVKAELCESCFGSLHCQRLQQRENQLKLNLGLDPHRELFIAKKYNPENINSIYKIIGYLHLDTGDTNTSIKNKTHHYILSLCVDEKERGNHVGYRLLTSAIQYSSSLREQQGISLREQQQGISLRKQQQGITPLELDIKQQGITHLELHTNCENHAAINLYESVGFIKIKQVLNAYKIDNPYQPDAYLMKLSLM